MLVKTREVTIPVTNSKYQPFYHWFALIVLLCFVLFGGTISAIMPAYLPDVCISLTDGISGVQRIAVWLHASYISGFILGAFGCQLTGHRIGYKRFIVFAVFCYSFFTILAGTSFTWQWVVMCRFLAGVGVGSVLVAVVFFISLSWQWQAKSVVGLFIAVAFSCGVFLAGALVLTVTDWKEVFMGGVVPLTLSAVALWALREPEKIEAAEKDESKIFSDGYRHKIATDAIPLRSVILVFLILLSFLPTLQLDLLTTIYQRGLFVLCVGCCAILVSVIMWRLTRQ